MPKDVTLQELLNALGGDGVDVRLKSKCQHPKCKKDSRDTHHLTYEPEVVTRLCRRHHRAITIINSNAAYKLGCKLTDRERMALWLDWLEGKVKPIHTKEAMAWVDR